MDLTTVQVVQSAAIGLGAGLLGGLAGIGGSIVMLPGLALIVGRHADASAQHLFQAAAMPVNALVSLPATWQHHKAGAIDTRTLRTLLPATTLAIILGVLISEHVSGERLRLILAAFIGLYALDNLRRVLTHTPEPEANADPDRHASRTTAAGVVTGTVSGLLGIGGGILLVPILQTLCRLPLKRAIATSAAVMCFTAVVGGTLKVTGLPEHGYTPGEALMLSAAMAPTAMIGASLGARLTHALPLKTVRALIAVLLAYAAAKLAGLV